MTAFEFTSSSKTSVGNVRTVNEDACIDSIQNGIWAVADGMGGHQSGDLASRLITQSLAGIKQENTLEETIGKVKDCLISTNLFLLDEASLRKGNQTIGSTVVVFITFNHQCAVLWVGDSRLYRLRKNTLELITSDHSQVQELVDLGLLLPEDAESHPSANVITRAVGASSILEIDDKQFNMQEGDIFLLCSDGLYKELNETEIATILMQHPTKKACDELIDTALRKQCRDNVTVIVIAALVAEKTILRCDTE
jgi:serine/threonine protein phosphatase PrpC